MPAILTETNARHSKGKEQREGARAVNATHRVECWKFADRAFRLLESEELKNDLTTPSRLEPIVSGSSGYSVATAAELSGKQIARKPIDSSVSNFPPGSSVPSGLREGARNHQPPKSLSKTYEQLEIELREAREKLQVALDGKEEIRREWKQATRDLNKLQAERNFKLDDDTLATAWKQLRYEIKGWAYEHFDGELKGNLWRVTPPPKSLTQLVSNLKAYVRSPTHRPLLVQAFVWNRLQRNVFTDETLSGLIWAGTEHMRFTKLYDLLKPSELSDV